MLESLSKSAWREVNSHMRSNPTAIASRRPFRDVMLRVMLRRRTFLQVLIAYLVLNLIAVLAEIYMSTHLPSSIPEWTRSGAAGVDIKALILQVSTAMLAASVGVLGALSIAIALVSLLSGAEESRADIRLYYDASLAFPLFSVFFALVVILSAQLLWPMQFLVHRLGYGTELQFFKLILTGVHLGIFLFLLGGSAHFVATTYSFVEKSSRQKIRQFHLANEGIPSLLHKQLFHELILGWDKRFRSSQGQELQIPEAVVHFELHMGGNAEEELSSHFKKPVELVDVKGALLGWVIKSWYRRSRRANGDQILIWLNFPRLPSSPLNGKITWCFRHGGEPLTRLERLALRFAFKFRRLKHAS